MNKCRYLRQRHKKGELYYFCAKSREIVELCDCRGCFDKEYKEAKKLVAKKPMKKVSKKRKTVSKKTYEEVFNQCNGRCAICGTTQNLEYHHIYYRSERPDLIDDPDNGIMLCGEFANNCHKGKAHKNKKYWQPILLQTKKRLANFS